MSDSNIALNKHSDSQGSLFCVRCLVCENLKSLTGVWVNVSPLPAPALDEDTGKVNTYESLLLVAD